jgi:hypothetical protein
MMNVSKLGTLTCYGVTDTTDVCGLVYRAEGANGRIYIYIIQNGIVVMVWSWVQTLEDRQSLG